MHRGMGRCSVCGGKPSPRSPKGRLCEKHVEMRAANMRRLLGCKKVFVLKTVWPQLDWTLGPKLISAMLGVSRRTVKDHYKRLLATHKIKAVPGFVGKCGRSIW